MAGRPVLYLIDGSSYIYRAYYAIRHLSSPRGFPTNALYGFTQMLLKVLKERSPDHVAVVFDAGRKTFRNDIYPDYKANRASMPDDLVPQIAPIKEMVRAFNIPALELAGYEADDIIGTIARDCENKGVDVVVVTGDKDLMQIVTDQVRLLDTMKEKESGGREVEERFGVGPGAGGGYPRPGRRQLRQYPRRSRHRRKNRHQIDPGVWFSRFPSGAGRRGQGEKRRETP